MKNCLGFIFAFIVVSATAQQAPPTTLKSVLLEQLRTTHNVQDWFVPASNAIAGLTPQQANWKDNKGNHSIAQITTHLIFWNKQMLEKFNGMKPDAFDGDNKETFSEVDIASWTATTQLLDSVFSAWETAVKNADDEKLKEWYSTIAHIGTHNAYHTGQIIYIRKMNGWWDDSKGVK